jgi:uncharacterized oxidoreductase
MKLSGNKILITGGASGIGRGIAERFLQEGNTIIVCGRREDVLQQMAAVHQNLVIRQCDLEKPEEREALFAWVAAEHPDTNVLVNNAGIQNWMNPAEKDFYRRAHQEIAINVEAPLHLTSLFLGLPALTTIMNVTSGLAFAPLAKVPVYSATKAFFHSFTLSLRYLLKGRSIEVIEIVPPAINTDLGGKGIHDSFPPVSEFIRTIFDQLSEGKQQLTFGHSGSMVKLGPDQLDQLFNRVNP